MNWKGAWNTWRIHSGEYRNKIATVCPWFGSNFPIHIFPRSRYPFFCEVCISNDGFFIKHDEFAIKWWFFKSIMMNFTDDLGPCKGEPLWVEMRNLVFITRNCVFKTRNFAFKMMNFQVLSAAAGSIMTWLRYFWAPGARRFDYKWWILFSKWWALYLKWVFLFCFAQMNQGELDFVVGWAPAGVFGAILGASAVFYDFFLHFHWFFIGFSLVFHWNLRNCRSRSHSSCWWWVDAV